MKQDNLIWILVIIAVTITAFIIVRSSRKTEQENTANTSQRGFWDSLFSNAADIIDSGGRHTSSATTSLGNAITSIIATSRAEDGTVYYSPYGYSNKPQDNGPYIIAGSVILTAGIIAVLLLKK